MAEVKRAYGNRYRLESMYCDMCDVTHLKNIFNFLYKKNKFTFLYRDILLNMAASPVRFPKDGMQTKSYKSKFLLVEWFEIDTNVKA